VFKEDKNSLVAEFKFNNFKEALDFVNHVGVLAENANHHPDISFGWGYVKIILTTHSAGGITDQDYNLAKEIENAL
jgi:4a-hydroxytetrahydrobiopterin dehydratase